MENTDSRSLREIASEKQAQGTSQHHPLHQAGMRGQGDLVRKGLTPYREHEPRRHWILQVMGLWILTKLI